MEEQVQEDEIVIVKENFLLRIARSIREFFSKRKEKKLLLNNGNISEKNEDEKIQQVPDNSDFTQLEILDARRAFRKYVINSNKDISNEILSYVSDKVKENEEKIKQIIEINKDTISYNDILELIENEKKMTQEFKMKDKKTGRYNVPYGVIGVECDNAMDAIENIFKAISTRNSIIVLHNNFNKYSTESLILLIVKECLKNFYIDDNIIQMFEKEEIDLTKLDKLIVKEAQEGKEKNTVSNNIYIYQEDDGYEKIVLDEVNRLQSSEIYRSYNIKPIKGEFANVINYLNKNDAPAVCMYTNNAQKAYKFINWINSPNVFVNTGIKTYKSVSAKNSDYFNDKYVLHEDVF